MFGRDLLDLYKDLFYIELYTDWSFETILSFYPFEKDVMYQLHLDQKQRDLENAKDR